MRVPSRFVVNGFSRVTTQNPFHSPLLLAHYRLSWRSGLALARRTALLVLLLPLLAASAAPPALTVAEIMRGPGLVGYEPREARWSGDSQRIYFSWKQPSDPVLAEPDTYIVNRDGSGLRKLTD